ncbi:serine carboxypeptidase S28-domain-containing protein [Crucibulum laeve]|uniref:Serine carboxypeptidase S28-domain-containing protein n=1 Tax=Crucibulum laeve TaxID=68775 RepID=A0A5C3MIP4_9AGAR|nr:serine carboxypeptidase S28-domain-containing protein [Crucibulum laeve]
MPSLGFCKWIALYASLTLLPLLASASLPDGRLHGNMMHTPSIPVLEMDAPDGPVISRNGTVLPDYSTTYYFDQLVDHNNPSLGTFKQRFWHTYEFYEPGGPIVLFTPGENNADGYYVYLTNISIFGLIAQQQSGCTVLLEHRFFGFSNPYPDLSVESLKVHTIQQAIDDLEYFTKNVNLPMPNGDRLTPDKAPWILAGGSYSAALTSWAMVNKPDVFFAGYASSAVVESVLNFWQYFEPIRQYMPQNCSADIQAVIAHIDQVFTGPNTTAIQAIKDSFGMGELTHLDDVAGALRNNLWDWQSMQPTTGPGAQFYQFCDALEVKDGQNAPVNGWGVDNALAAWGAYFKDVYLTRLCGAQSALDCLGTYDGTQTYWTDISINNSVRSWMWMVCNELGWFQDSPPLNRPSIVTRLVQPDYDMRQCQQMFPGAFPEIPFLDVTPINRVYQGWQVENKNLFFANGLRDPWKDATMSAEGLNVKSTPLQPIALGGGFHCSDLKAASGAADPTIGAVQAKALKSMHDWLAAWKPSKNQRPPVRSPRSTPQGGHQGAQPHTHTKPVNAWSKGSGTL